MSLLTGNSLTDGCNSVRVADFSLGERIAFSIVRLKPGESHGSHLSRAETAVIVLGGRCNAKCGDITYENVGERANVFAGRASAVYAPPGCPVEIAAATDLEVAICATPATKRGELQLISPRQVTVRSVGQSNWRRDVHDIIGANVDAQSLLVGETYNPPGNWSSYPPHKHDRDDPPHEAQLEELYHFRVDPPGGFGVQRVYSAEGDLDETVTVRGGDTVVIPRGYHPVAAAPGYRLYYLWILAGDTRLLRWQDDPQHHWIKAVETILAETSRDAARG